MKISSKYLNIICVTIILLSFHKLSAKEILHKRLTKKEGLISNTIYKVVQDSFGNIWMATGFGVSKYNGKTYEHFTSADGLSDNDIISVHKDSKGRIWFFGYRGTACFWLNGVIYNERNFPFLKNIKTNYCFISLFEDSKKRIWLGSYGETLVVNQELTQLFPSLALPGSIDFFENYPNYLSFRPNFEDEKFIKIHSFGQHLSLNAFLMFTKNFLVLRQGKEVKKILRLSEAHRKSKVLSVRLIGEILWLGGDFGLEQYNIYEIEKGCNKFFQNTFVTTLFDDKEGTLWVNTVGSGILLIPKWAANVSHIYPTKETMNFKGCYSIERFEKKHWALGLDYGRLVLTNQSKEEEQKNIELQNTSYKTDNLYAVDKRLFASYNVNLKYIDSGRFSPKQALFKDNNKPLKRIGNLKQMTHDSEYLYFTGTHAVFRARRKKTVAEFHIIYNSTQKKFAIYLSMERKLYLGVENGLKALEGNKFVGVPKVTSRVNHIAETPDSALLLATFGEGLLLLKNHGIIRPIQEIFLSRSQFGKKVKFLNGKIFFLAEDGLHVFNWKNNVLKEISLEITDFLRQYEIYDFQGNDSELGLATDKGAFIIPFHLFEPNDVIPSVFIERVNNSSYFYFNKQALLLPYEKREIRFTYSSPNFKGQETFMYRYKIKNDGNWVYTKDNQVSFPFLGSGDYTFSLEAKNGESSWGAAIPISFTVEEPYWEKWWFTTIICLIIGGFLFIVYKRRMILKRQAELKLETEQRKLRDLEQQALLTLMNPHFVFNVMNSIQGFINSKDPRNANQYLSGFAQLIRMNLDISYKKHVFISEEIEYLNLYLKFENLRLGGGLDFSFSIDGEDDLTERKIAAMMVQPLIENAIWHGLSDLENKKIVVNFNQLEADLVEVIVEDNGRGIDEKYIQLSLEEWKTKAHGMGITFQRLQLINHQRRGEAILKFKHLEPNSSRKGTQVRILLPLN